MLPRGRIDGRARVAGRFVVKFAAARPGSTSEARFNFPVAARVTKPPASMRPLALDIVLHAGYDTPIGGNYLLLLLVATNFEKY